jgi:sulfate transport system substrate-binding protein
MNKLPKIFSNKFVQRWHLPTIIGMSLIVFLVYSAYMKTRADGLVKLIIYAYSTQEEVLNLGIAPAFKKEWKAETGQDVEIEMVFGPSGTMAGQILLGAPADLAIFSSESHVNLLKHGNLLRSDNTPAYLASTPMVIVTRPGNPLAITSFRDLAKPGINLLHADPRISGAGDWSVLAEYGSSYMLSGDDQAAADQLKSIWDNVVMMGDSARSTLGLFMLGVGDAMITYEEHGLIGIRKGLAIEVVMPERTIIAQHIMVLVDDNVSMSERPAAEALLQFIQGETGQKIYQDFYWLSAKDVQSKGCPRDAKYFTVEDLGGWENAKQELIDKLWGAEIYPQLSLMEEPALDEYRGTNE